MVSAIRRCQIIALQGHDATHRTRLIAREVPDVTRSCPRAEFTEKFEWTHHWILTHCLTSDRNMWPWDTIGYYYLFRDTGQWLNETTARKWSINSEYHTWHRWLEKLILDLLWPALENPKGPIPRSHEPSIPRPIGSQVTGLQFEGLGTQRTEKPMTPETRQKFDDQTIKRTTTLWPSNIQHESVVTSVSGDMLYPMNRGDLFFKIYFSIYLFLRTLHSMWKSSVSRLQLQEPSHRDLPGAYPHGWQQLGRR